MKHYSFEILNKLISEIYPFTTSTIKELEDYLEFEWLSRNKNIRWSVELVTIYYNRWCWSSLEENSAVFNNLTLGLFFPEKVKLPTCDCFRNLEFCDYGSCSVNYNKFYFAKSLYSSFPDGFITISMMCDSGFIDLNMLKEFYTTRNVEKLMRFKVSI